MNVIPDKKLFLFTVILITIAIIASYTLSAYIVAKNHYDFYHFVLRESISGFLSILIMWILSRLNPDVWIHRIGITLFVVGMILMAAMPFLPESLVKEVGGAKRWIQLPFLSLAPVEFFKIGFIYFLAWSFSRKFTHGDTLDLRAELKRFIPYAALFLIAVFLIAFLQNDLGQVVVLALTLAIMLLFAGSSGLFIVYLILAAIVVFSIIILSSENRINRILAWWEGAQNTILAVFPESIATHLRTPNADEPYQIGHSLNAIHNGGLFGAGLGGGTFKLGFLSEVHTDFVLSGIAEEFGFFGVLLVTFFIAAVLFRIFKIAGRSRNNVYYLFCIGVGLLISLAFMINAYGICGWIPIKGIAVPFLSYGGSSMLASSIAIGMVLMISKKASKTPLQDSQ
jgi:cell division protein FtsW